MTLESIRRIREIGAKLVDPELTAQIFEEMGDGLLLLDHKGTIQLVNKRAEILFGYHRTELFDQPMEILLPSAHQGGHRQELLKFFEEPRRRLMGIEQIGLTGRRKDGSEFPCEIMLGPIITYVDSYCIAAIRLPHGGTDGSAG